jgi:hypothetical protein
MAEQITFQIIFQFLQTVGILVGVFYYIMTIRTNQRNQEIAQKNQELTLKAQEHSTETRQLDIFMRYQILRTDPDWNITSQEVYALEWNNFDDFARRYSHSENPEGAGKRFAIWNYWEGIGYILSRGVIDPETAYDMFGNGCISFWFKFEPIIRGFRERDGRPEGWRWFEYLAEEMKKVRERRGMPEYTMPWRPE